MHLEQVRKSTGVAPKQLKEAENFPSHMSYIWEVYQELRANGNVSFAELNSWCLLTSIKLSPQELKLITRLNAVFAEVSANE